MERRVLATFLGADGRLTAMPRRRTKRLIVLDHIAQSFEPGRAYPESDVDVILARFHPDAAALRRHLVDDEFLTREDNVYWRSGGTFQV